MQNEIWKDVVGYEGLYQVSNLGRVKSLDRLIVHYTGSKSKLKGKIKIQSSVKGYKVVGLCKDGILKQLKVHRLVLSAFDSNVENKPEVNHKNGIKSDNELSNLEWCTSSENSIHAHKTGLHKGSHLGLKGIKSPNRKPVVQLDLKGNKIKDFVSVTEASESTGVFSQNISFVCNGKYKQAGGYKWEYVK